jgi:hypothetical protein
VATKRAITEVDFFIGILLNTPGLNQTRQEWFRSSDRAPLDLGDGGAAGECARLIGFGGGTVHLSPAIDVPKSAGVGPQPNRPVKAMC